MARGSLIPPATTATMRIRPVKAIYVLLGVLITPLALGQDARPSQDLADSAPAASGQSCLTACEQVFADCEDLCRDTSARAHERSFETPDLPVDACLKNCSESLSLCKQDC